MNRLIQRMKNELSDVYAADELESVVRILLSHYLKLSPAEACLREKAFSAKELDGLQDAIRLLKQHCPVQYVTGETEFYGLRFKVTPDVLIPRPETEELTEMIVRRFQARTSASALPLKILDIGTGSGCMAVALAAALPSAEVWAMDISQPALEVAAHNAALNRVQVHFVRGDILSATAALLFPAERFDIIASNPPYVTQEDKQFMHERVCRYEPHQALFPGSHPLIFYEHIALFAQQQLKPQGYLYLEINEALPHLTADILKRQRFRQVTLRKDMREKWRFIEATNSV
ncbi:MAG: peptide chain release factor N(5)-glutamine methyltransferase [Bacteroidales bacterium]|jgi:release factor glutamine methyltransferase|nr:peptide chain release factor N(5)-glutamine methyltransferase [Bacteroidales bacterium]